MTIYQALKAKLGREPKRTELKAEVARIIAEAVVDLAEQGRLPHQAKGT